MLVVVWWCGDDYIAGERVVRNGRRVYQLVSVIVLVAVCCVELSSYCTVVEYFFTSQDSIRHKTEPTRLFYYLPSTGHM